MTRLIPVQSGVHAGLVDVTCWCEAFYVSIPKAWVGTRTRSCGRPDCRPRNQNEALRDQVGLVGAGRE